MNIFTRKSLPLAHAVILLFSTVMGEDGLLVLSLWRLTVSRRIGSYYYAWMSDCK